MDRNSFQFYINPEPRHANLNLTEENYVDVAFTVQNKSRDKHGVPVGATVEILIEGLEGPPPQEDPDGTGWHPRYWQGWLSLQEKESNTDSLEASKRFTQTEWTFDPEGIRVFTVRIQLPEAVRQGDYKFRLVIIGVEDPDHECVYSDPVTFSVKSVDFNIRRFLVIGLIFLGIVIVGALALAFLFEPDPRLNVTLNPPTLGGTVGEVMTYTLSIENEREMTATHVLMTFKPPEGIIAATAFVPDSTFRYCDESNGDIQCNIGELGPRSKLDFLIQAVPGPGASIITHTNILTVSSRLDNNQTITPAKVTQESTLVGAAQGLSLVIDPNIGTPTVDEPVTYRLLAWNNLTRTETLSITYTLPKGMRFARTEEEQEIILPPACQQGEDDYFMLHCIVGPLGYQAGQPEVAELNIVAIPNEIASELTHTATASTSGQDISEVETDYAMTVVNSALIFDGISDYAELGLNRALETFTAEFWIHPYRNNDGQNFIGAHRESLENLNVFLVGYYSGNLNVTIGEDFHSIAAPKRTDRFHVAVTVEKLSERQSKVTVFVNGQPQAWLEPESTATCEFCKLFDAAMDGQETRPWVLGQDWDPIGQTIRASDFFEGTMSDVVIWGELRTQEEILSDMRQRPRGDELTLVVASPLLPVTPDSRILANYAGENGLLFGPHWGASNSRFGGALLFDGNNDYLTVPGLRLSDFTVGQEDKVQVTLAGWVYVDNIPSQEQWLMGFTSASATTISLPPTSGTLNISATETALDETIGAVTNAESTQAALAVAQGDLLSAIEAKEALGVDLEQARIELQEARDTVYLTLEPFSQSDSLDDTFAPARAMINQVTTLIDPNSGAVANTLSTLQTVSGIETPVIEVATAKQVYDMVRGDSVLATDASSTGPIRSQYQLRQTELAYAQSLVNLWQIVASNTITQTGALVASPSSSASQALTRLAADVNQANAASDQLRGVANAVAELSPADQVLLRLATLELAEQEQLAASFFALALSEVADPVETILTRSGANNTAAIQNIGEAQTALNDALAVLKPWLENQLDEDVRFLLFPDVVGSIQSDQLRERLLQESGLVGYWDFNEGGGQIVGDRAGSGLTGTFQADTAFISDVPLSPEREFNPYSLNFTGAGGVEINGADHLNLTTASFSVWIKSDPNIETDHYIFDNSSNNGTFSYRLLLNGPSELSGRVTFSFLADEGLLNLTSQAVVNDNRWHHVAVTRDSQRFTLYVDGIAQGDSLYSGRVRDVPGSILSIGKSPDFPGSGIPTSNFTGSIDDLRFYNRLLTADEISVLAGGDAPIRVDEELTLRKLLAVRAVEVLQSAEASLVAVQEAELDLAAAQAAVVVADEDAARIEALRESAGVALAERQTLIDAVTIAQNNVQILSGTSGAAGQLQAPRSGQSVPATLEAATAQLSAAQDALAQAQEQQLQSLASAIATLQVREETLQDLDSRLDVAINNAVEAGLQATQKNNVELLIGPFLDWILGTRTPRRTNQEVAQEAALLAAQQSLKSEVDFNVDAAQANYDAAIAERDRLINSGGNGRLRQEIIDNINAYLESLNADVDSAKQSLDEALSAQQGRQSEPDIPLVLADALAQEVARRVAIQIAMNVRPSYRQIVTPNPAIGQQISLQIQRDLANALETTRNPVRWQLYVDTYFVINQLNQVLASGTIDSDIDRQLTVELRDELVSLNLAILRVLDSENSILQPQFGFEALLDQVADERNRAQNQSELIDMLTSALDRANQALDAYILIQNRPGQSKRDIPGVAKIASTLTSDTLKINPILTVRLGDGIIPPEQDENPGEPIPTATPPEETTTDDALLEGIDNQGTTTSATSVEPVDETTDNSAMTQPLPPPIPPNIWFGLIIDDDGHVAAIARPRSVFTWAVAKDEQPILVGQWVHYTAEVIYDSRTGVIDDIRLIRNGDEVKGFDLVQDPINVQVDTVNCVPNFYFGGLCNTNRAFSFAGRLDEIRVWDRLISEEEIDGWRDLPGEFYDELAYWAFDDGPGQSSDERCPRALTCDASGNNFHLTVSGPGWVAADYGLNSFLGNGRR